MFSLNIFFNRTKREKIALTNLTTKNNLLVVRFPPPISRAFLIFLFEKGLREESFAVSSLLFFKMVLFVRILRSLSFLLLLHQL
jgi:hypothetical protein